VAPVVAGKRYSGRVWLSIGISCAGGRGSEVEGIDEGGLASVGVVGAAVHAAVVIVPLILMAPWRAKKQSFEAHKCIAR